VDTPKRRRATKWLTVLIFRPLTGKSKKTSLYVCELFLCDLCGL
jgi:phage terminase large subunit-like protein